jgi:hypothetical protein
VHAFLQYADALGMKAIECTQLRRVVLYPTVIALYLL